MSDSKYEYVVLSLSPGDDADKFSDKLNAFGQLGFKPLPPVQQGESVIYTLYLEAS